MGNQLELRLLCTSDSIKTTSKEIVLSDNENMLTESYQKTLSKQFTAQRKLSQKCEFVYLKPIKFSDSPNNSHLPVSNDTLSSKNKTKEYQSISKENQIENLLSSLPKLTTEDIEIENQDRESLNRILVQWSSFIKIKKKNYLDDYKHIKEIGQGAFGSVSKIKMKYGGMYRAAKTVKISTINMKESQRQKFISEIVIPMKTDHPNLNKLFEVFEWNNQYTLIMELCEGGDLFTTIKNQKAFTESKVAEIMKQILSGVVYLHKNNIVHRDLKPENMLYDNESQMVKIIDFGSSIELPPGRKLSTLTGTPYYIAPEVISGEYTEKCDVWSCGVIFYILLCGSPPFYGRDEAEIMSNIQNKPISFSSPIWKKRSKECKKLVMQMLTKDYNERISALDVLNSEWVLNSANFNSNELGVEVINNLTSFHFQNKLKAVVYTYIASQLYSNKDKEKLLHCFREIDKDGDGVIGKEELVNIFNKHQKSNMKDVDIDSILKIVDTNGSGLIDFTEFLVAASNEEELLEKERLENAFSYLDTDHSGYITAEEIMPFLDNTEKTSDEINQILEQVDANGDGKISMKEFVALLVQKV